jgi:hypothetical protein
LPVPLQAIEQPLPGHELSQLPWPLQLMVQPPPWQVKKQLPVPSHSKVQFPSGQSMSQFPIPLQVQVRPDSQVPTLLPIMQAGQQKARTTAVTSIQKCAVFIGCLLGGRVQEIPS